MKAFDRRTDWNFCVDAIWLRICSRSGIVRRVWKHIPDRIGLGDWRYARYLLNPAFSIICLIAPLTQAGLNPARDFGPRLVSWLAGWGEVAFPDACCGGFFFVYILAPILGGAIAAYALTYVIEPLIKQGDGSCECEK